MESRGLGEKSASQRIQAVLMQIGAQFRETKGTGGCLQLGKSAQRGEPSTHLQGHGNGRKAALA